jgi:hypothetical protein
VGFFFDLAFGKGRPGRYSFLRLCEFHMLGQVFAAKSGGAPLSERNSRHCRGGGVSSEESPAALARGQ